jgi:hypothetical protein
MLNETPLCNECHRHPARFRCSYCGHRICGACREKRAPSRSVVGHLCSYCAYDEAVINWEELPKSQP